MPTFKRAFLQTHEIFSSLNIDHTKAHTTMVAVSSRISAQMPRTVSRSTVHCTPSLNLCGLLISNMQQTEPIHPRNRREYSNYAPDCEQQRRRQLDWFDQHDSWLRKPLTNGGALLLVLSISTICFWHFSWMYDTLVALLDAPGGSIAAFITGWFVKPPPRRTGLFW